MSKAANCAAEQLRGHIQPQKHSRQPTAESRDSRLETTYLLLVTLLWPFNPVHCYSSQYSRYRMGNVDQGSFH